VRQYADDASDEDWTRLIAQMGRSDDPGRRLPQASVRTCDGTLPALANRPPNPHVLRARFKLRAMTKRRHRAERVLAMSLFALLLNLLWIVCGGAWMAAGWLLASVIMAITIIGIPWARAAFNIAAYTLLPFGQTAVSRADYFGQEDTGTGPLGFIGNLVWLVLAGWWLALGHLITAILLAVTIIGIPFAWAHLKLAGLALWPIGKMIVPRDELPPRYMRRG
jgi:uncharacterized membrane protein YccF (DUF307 family)